MESKDFPDSEGYWAFEGAIFGSSVERVQWVTMVRENSINNELYAHRFGGHAHMVKQMIGKWWRVQLPWDAGAQGAENWMPVNTVLVGGESIYADNIAVIIGYRDIAMATFVWPKDDGYEYAVCRRVAGAGEGDNNNQTKGTNDEQSS